MNIYTDATNDLKQQEFRSLENYLRTDNEYKNITDVVMVTTSVISYFV